MASEIFILDDDDAFLQTMAQEVGGSYTVTTAQTIEQFHERFVPYRFDLAVIDMRLRTDKEGLNVLREILRLDPLQPVVVATAYADTSTFLETIEVGALMYLDKKRIDSASLGQLLDAVIQQGKLRRQFTASARHLERSEPVDIIGSSDGLRRLRDEAARLARVVDRPVIIAGELGSGKEHLARNIFARAAKKGAGSFCTVHASALLAARSLEAFLFGDYSPSRPHPRPGLLPEAHEGAFLVRDADQLPAEMGDRLLEIFALQRFSPVGSTLVFSLRARLFLLGTDVAALERLAVRARAEFVSVDPLRECAEDIPLLAAHTLETFRQKNSTAPLTLSAAVQNFLTSFAWPGNVAEFKAALQFACVQAYVAGQRTIDLAHLPVQLQSGISLSFAAATEPVWDLEYEEARGLVHLVARAIEHFGTTRKGELAQRLGALPSTLTRKVERALERYPKLGALYAPVKHLFGETTLRNEAA